MSRRGARVLLALAWPLLVAAGGLPEKPPAPTLNHGLLTVRVDPAKPEVYLDWNVSTVAGASGIDWEISAGPFPNKNPEKLTEHPLREGHFSGRSGWGKLDLAGLGEGEYFVRYLAVGPGGRPVSLASDPVRFVIIGRGPGPASRPPSSPAPTRTAPPTPAPIRTTAPQLPPLDPARATVALGGSLQFRVPSGEPAQWRVREGAPAGSVDASGLYRAPAELPGGPMALTGVATVEAVLPDGQVFAAQVVLVRPKP